MASTPTWIKIRHDLESDPRVHTMAAHIAQTAPGYILTTQAKDLFGSVTNTVTRNALRDVTILGLLRVWFAANEHTTDGVFRHATLEYLDTLSNLPGFGEAMKFVGYALHDPENRTLTLPNFTEHNAPNKNGNRSKTANAERQERFRIRHKEKAEAAAKSASENPASSIQHPASNPLQVTPTVTLHEETSNVIPSYSSSSSKSTEGTLLNQTPEAAATPPSEPDPLGTLKKRINALRPKTWGKMINWSNEDESALFTSLDNLLLLDTQDWLLLEWFMKWANTAANANARDPVRVTSRRHQFVSDISSYLDRATAAWKQSGAPRLDKPPAPTVTVKPAAAPTPPPAPAGQNADAFAKLLTGYGGQLPPPKSSPVPTKPTPAAA